MVSWVSMRVLSFPCDAVLQREGLTWGMSYLMDEIVRPWILYTSAFSAQRWSSWLFLFCPQMWQTQPVFLVFSWERALSALFYFLTFSLDRYNRSHLLKWWKWIPFVILELFSETESQEGALNVCFSLQICFSNVMSQDSIKFRNRDHPRQFKFNAGQGIQV